MKITRAILICGLVSGAFVFQAPAASLSGQVGNKRYTVQFNPSQPTNPCKKAYDAYIKAGGHSAYAQTPSGRLAHAEASFCGVALNAPSEAAAKERAVANCKRTGEKYKVKTAGRCEVYVSK